MVNSSGDRDVQEPGPICVSPREWLGVWVPDFPPADDLQERVWTQAETNNVLRLYATGCSIYDLDDENTVPMSGDAYTREDQQLMRGMYMQGRSLPLSYGEST